MEEKVERFALLTERKDGLQNGGQNTKGGSNAAIRGHHEV